MFIIFNSINQIDSFVAFFPFFFSHLEAVEGEMEDTLDIVVSKDDNFFNMHERSLLIPMIKDLRTLISYLKVIHVLYMLSFHVP